jgi:hypothetical protein
LSFCTPFSALHSSARNHAAWFSMFKTSGEHSGTYLGSISVSGSITDTGIEPITSPAEKAVATTGRHLSTKKEKFIFLLQHKVRKGKNLKPCGRTTQLSAGLHCQARNQRRRELVRGCLARRLEDFWDPEKVLKFHRPGTAFVDCSLFMIGWIVSLVQVGCY